MTTALFVQRAPSGTRDCARVLRANGKSFAFASLLLDRDRRADAAALYAWCRRADDAIDTPQTCPERSLSELRYELDSVYAGRAQRDPAIDAFQRVVLGRGIPVDYPAELLNGMQMDLEGTRFERMNDLFGYCHRVAGTVGAMMCHVLGLSDQKALVHAAELGVAMQLTNICRDVHEDWQRGRLYVPREMCDAVGAADLPDIRRGPLDGGARYALSRATAALLDEAERWYASGERGLSALSFRSAYAIRCASRIYARIGDHLRARGCDPLAPRAVVPLAEKLSIAASCLGKSLLEVPRRVSAPHGEAPIRYIVRFSHGDGKG